jgi:hypothetical protein
MPLSLLTRATFLLQSGWSDVLRSIGTRRGSATAKQTPTIDSLGSTRGVDGIGQARVLTRRDAPRIKFSSV